MLTEVGWGWAESGSEVGSSALYNNVIVVVYEARGSIGMWSQGYLVRFIYFKLKSAFYRILTLHSVHDISLHVKVVVSLMFSIEPSL